VLTSELPIVRPGLGMLLTVQHALRNDFVPAKVTRDLLDLAGWFRVLAADPAEASWTELETARRGLVAPVNAMAEVLADCGVPSPLRIPAHPGAGRLAKIWREQADGLALNTDLVWLVSPRLVWRVVRGMLCGRRGRLDLMRRMEEANGEPSRPFAQRLRGAWKAARRTTLSRWWRLRELARAKRMLEDHDPGL
jgi:hypothetical protein